MKKSVLFLIVIFLFSFVSASYKCSDGSSFIEDKKEIEIKKTKNINGLWIGIASADETPALGSYSALILIDARRVSLSSQTPSSYVDLTSVSRNITLINLTGENVIISVDGSSGTVSLGNIERINNLEVFMFEKTGSYPGTGSVELIIGVEKFSLTAADYSKRVSLASSEYLVQLFSASDDNAIIDVKKCKNGNITEIEDVPKDNITNNSIVNGSNVNTTDINTSSHNITFVDNESVSGTVNQSNQEVDSNITKESDSKEKKKSKIYIIIIIIGSLIIIVFIIFFIRLKRKINS